MRTLTFVGVLLLSMLGSGLGARAQDYPTRPITIVVPWPAGGVADFLARVTADQLSKKLGQAVVVTNRPGAGTNLGSEYVAKAAPDGYTLLLASTNNAVNMTLFSHMAYDTAKDFAPVSLLAIVPNVLVANPKLPIHTVQDLVANAKKNPGKISVATAGNGSPAHLAAVEFMGLTGTKMLIVPYKGAAPAVIDLMKGVTDVMFTNIPASIGLVRGGKLRAIAVCSQKRSPALPDLPTVAESGVPGYNAFAWYGLVAPAKTPAKIIGALGKALQETMKSPEVVDRLVKEGTEPVISSPEALAEQINKDISHYRVLIKEAHVEIQ